MTPLPGAAMFRLETFFETTLCAHGSPALLCHADAPPPHEVILGRRVGTRGAILTRADGAPFRTPYGADDDAAPTLAISLEPAEADRLVLRVHGRRLLTAIPGGDILGNRQAAGGWESYTPVPHDMPDPPPLDDEDPAFIAAGLVNMAPDAVRAALPGLRSRPGYGRIFDVARAAISGDEERFEWTTQLRLADSIAVHGWSIGDHTYGGPEIIDGQYGKLRIGRYCAIAGNVKIIVANHATATATTYPFRALRRFWPSAPDDVDDHDSRGGVDIGDNVWIGAGATFLPGARVGDGAIIGAEAVVAGSVPPFAVAVGNPAQVRRLRFDAETVRRLLALRWWDWPDHVVDRFIPLLLGPDVAAFLDQAEAFRGAP